MKNIVKHYCYIRPELNNLGKWDYRVTCSTCNWTEKSNDEHIASGRAISHQNRPTSTNHTPERGSR